MTETSLPETLPPGGWRDDAGLTRLCTALGGGEAARFVGGAVRDSLLGMAVKDVDIATVHRPEAVMERLKAAGIRAVPTGMAHGTVTAILPAGPVEITTLRHDVATDGRHATVAFASDWQQDAARRDFTMNALYADPETGAIHDYFDGRADLSAARVRFIGDAGTRIDEDHLRILRYFRFLARFGHADAASRDYAACVDKAATLMALSRERVADELLKLLGTADPVPALRLMIDGGIFVPIVPEAMTDGVDRVAALILRERAMGEAPDGLLRLTALLPTDPAVADKVAARLKLSNKARARIATALGEAIDGDARLLAYRLGTRGALDRIALGRALSPGDARLLAEWAVPRLPVGGGDLIARGLPAGPEVARTLRALEEKWIAAGYPGREHTLELADQLLER
ncbi:MAG: CCA tRNA nucleotidyltransferase [Sphingobium sp.]